jgi:hypothetical protein
MPIGAVGVVSPLREIITQFPNTAWLTSDIDANGNAAVGYNVSDTQKASHLIQLYGPSARGIAQSIGSIQVFTRACSDKRISRGPGMYHGSPAQIEFDGDGDA